MADHGRPVLSGVYLDGDFRRRGPRMGLILVLFAALVVLLVAVTVYGMRQ